MPVSFLLLQILEQILQKQIILPEPYEVMIIYQQQINFLSKLSNGEDIFEF